VRCWFCALWRRETCSATRGSCGVDGVWQVWHGADNLHQLGWGSGLLAFPPGLGSGKGDLASSAVNRRAIAGCTVKAESE
jgi:hypothetical protein